MYCKQNFIKRYSLILILLLCNSVLAQKIHVHNDYSQEVPFWGAFSANAEQIEVDIFLSKKELYVTHDKKDIDPKKTLESLYLSPIKKAFKLGFVENKSINLLIDIKSESYKTLEVLKKQLIRFYKTVPKNKVKIIISGNQPAVNDLQKYPDFIQFDYQSTELPTNKNILNKIGLISYNFKAFSVWNGKGKIVANEYKKLTEIINNVHQINKPIRFWATPDSKSSWKSFVDLKVDFINTDYPHKCSSYIKSLPKRWFKNTVFSKVYKPSYISDKKNTNVKNVILMIGDGNGLTQISSAVLANNGNLTLMQLKSMGLIKTQSADDFTTDSAAAGTALATGQKTYNRAIGVNTKGEAIKNITEVLSEQNYNTGCITTDDIFGATPSAFYAHQKDRGLENQIAKELLKSKLTLFAGGGRNKFSPADFKGKFNIVKSIKNISDNSAERLGYFFAGYFSSIRGVPSVLEGRRNKLARVTKESIQFLNKKDKPFFLMIEAAQIDSYGHGNSVAGIVTETIDFDKAITEAIKFADKDKETLVIVLADHETSGFSIPQGNVKTNQIEGAFFSHDHTGVMVPVFAYGPKSYEFEGCYENNEVFHKILKVLNISYANK